MTDPRTLTPDGAIDPARPWIMDPIDAPEDMNWGQTLFNPMGETSKVHFTRAWTFMFLGRIILFIVPVFASFILGLAGADVGFLWESFDGFGVPIPRLLVVFVMFMIVTEFTSFVVHTRRFSEAGRATGWALIVLLPLFLALGAFAGGVFGGVQAHGAMQAEMNKPAEVEAADSASETAGDEAPAAVEGESAEDTDTQAAADGESDASARSERGERRGRGGRGGPNGPPPTMQEMAVGMGLGLAIPLWLLASLGAMLWSLLFVSRLPNGGKGKFATGSQPPEGGHDTAADPEPYEMA